MHLFTKHGYDVTVANDGLEGHRAATEKPFDLVVADLNMPRMDGWGMLRLLRDDFATRELPVAFLSCHDDYRESLKALNAGAQAYFSKGTRLDALVTQVQGLLEPRRAFLEQLAAHRSLPVDLGPLGPRWVLERLVGIKMTGELRTKDHWASYRVWVDNGTLVHAFAQAGQHLAQGKRALNAFIASKGARGDVLFGESAPAVTLEGDPHVLLREAVTVLNQNEQKMRDNFLVKAAQIQVNPELYAVYSQVGPREWLEYARLICEKKLTPREVIASASASPVEVEETLKDLMRRGVVTFAP